MSKKLGTKDLGEAMEQMQKIQKANAEFLQRLAEGQMALVNELINTAMKHFDQVRKAKTVPQMVELHNQYFAETSKTISKQGKKLFELYAKAQPDIAGLLPPQLLAAAKVNVSAVSKPIAKPMPVPAPTPAPVATAKPVATAPKPVAVKPSPAKKKTVKTAPAKKATAKKAPAKKKVAKKKATGAAAKPIMKPTVVTAPKK